MQIEILQGDITETPNIEAIVNAANTWLTLGSGVARAIRRKGGDVIDEEGRAKAPIRLGEAAVTSAGAMPYQYVIHAAAMGYTKEDNDVPKRPGTATSEAIIRDATLNSLRRAEELQLKSLAFPALGTGVACFPVKDCAEVMIAAVHDYGANHPSSSIQRVVFVLFTDSDYRAFKRVSERI
jgi:O-acetyl-ADP-ribose deacetylase